jgi:hypothetical protein
MTDRRISGADDPSAMSVRFATVSFHTGVSIRNFFYPSLSNNSTYFVWEVISSMALKRRYYQKICNLLHENVGNDSNTQE